MKRNLILAIESSCDETAAAVVEDGCKICSNIVSSQINVHKKYGGVVPEVASRIHVEKYFCGHRRSAGAGRGDDGRYFSDRGNAGPRPCGFAACRRPGRENPGLVLR